MNGPLARPHVVVVGAGLAGLTAASLLGRAGLRVTVCERAGTLGGRAATHARGDYRLNLGPHALYLGGAAARELTALGVAIAGGAPPSGWALRGGRLHTLPTGAVSLLSTGLLSFAAKRRGAGLLARLQRLDVAALAGVALGRWLDERAPEPDLRAFLAASFRVATYCAELDDMSAGAALAQLRSAIDRGVRYLDGGWQTLVDGLVGTARAAHVTLASHAPVTAIGDIDAGGVRAVTLGDGRTLLADALVIAAAPSVAAALVPASASLRLAAAVVRPVRAACLDLALASLPRPRARFALGIDRPLYFSVHSGAAALAPGAGAVVHAARYLDGDDHADAERELEALCDRLQPGWRERVVARRFLPRLTVAHDLPRADRGGLAGRAPVAVADTPALFVAGDWVGNEGLLADAAVASATVAARAIVASLGARRAAA